MVNRNIQAQISDEVRRGAPSLKVIIVQAEVENPPTSDCLWEELSEVSQKIKDTFEMDQIKNRPAIFATRNAYKAFGKEPNRYRPSSEALCRRCVKGMELYRTSAIVDIINLVSLASGHSIGGFDEDAIEGDNLVLGVGQVDEPYEAIGRGQLNIAGLPVFRDAVGGIGTPTSDNERTKLSQDTRRLLMTINLYGPSEMSDEQVVEEMSRLLIKYAAAKNIRSYLIS